MATVGEVQAILTAKDNMSPAVIAAAQRVADLTATLAQLGATAGPAFDSLNSKLTAAQTNLEINTAGAKAGVTNFQNLGTAAQGAGEQISQLDRLATRMIERMVIFYALRGALKFTEDLFNNARALEELNNQTGISTGLLQGLQQGAEAAGIKFTEVTKAIDTLDKGLAEVKPAVADALAGLGLTFQDAFDMAPEVRFQKLAEAILAIKDPLQQAKAEIALFGTDSKAVLEDLSHAVTTGNDAQIQSLAEVDKRYTSLWANIKSGAASGIVAIQDFLAQAAGPLFALQSGGLPAFQQAILDAYKKSGTVALLGPLTGNVGMVGEDLYKLFTGNPNVGPNTNQDINLPAAGSGKSALMDQAFIDSLKALQPLTEKQREYLDQLKSMDELTLANAVHINGITAESYRAYTKELKDAAAAQRDQNEAAKEWEKEQEKIDKENEKIDKENEKQADTLAKAWDRIHNVIEASPPLQDFSNKLKEIGVISYDDINWAATLGKIWSIENNPFPLDKGLDMLPGRSPKPAPPIDESARVLGTLSTALGELNKAGGGIFSHWVTDLQAVTKEAQTVRTAFIEMGREGATSADKLVATIAVDVAVMSGFVRTIVAAQQGAGAGALSGAESGAALGFALGGPVGAVVGTVVGGAVGLIAGASADSHPDSTTLGPSKNDLATRSERQTFMSQFQSANDITGIQSLEDKLVQAGMTAQEAQAAVADLLNARRPQDFATAMVPVNAALREVADTANAVTGVNNVVGAWEHAGHVIPQSQMEMLQNLRDMPGLTDAERVSIQGLIDAGAPDYKLLDKEAQDLGITLSQLGPRFEQGDLNNKAKTYYQTVKDLENAGGDLTGILTGSSKKLGNLVTYAQTAGVALPKDLKPWIETLIAAGGFIDSAGNKITSLAGVNFADTPLNRGLETLNNTLRTLIATLLHIPLDVQAADAAAGFDRTRQPPTTPTPPIPPGGNPGNLDPTSPRIRPPAIPMAAGGMGTVTRPTLFLAGEGGPEQFAFSGSNAPFGSSSGAASSASASGDVYVTINAIDVQSFADAMRKPGGGIDVLIQDVGRGKRSRDVRLLNALGL